MSYSLSIDVPGLVELLVASYQPAAAPTGETLLQYLRRELAERKIPQPDEASFHAWTKTYESNARGANLHAALAALAFFPEKARSCDFQTVSRLKRVVKQALRNNQASYHVVECIIEANDGKFLNVRDTLGTTTLHDAATFNPSREVFELILNAGPQAASMHKHESYICRPPPGAEPGSYFMVLAGKCYINVPVPEAPSAGSSAVRLAVDQKMPFTSDNVITGKVDILSGWEGRAKVKAPEGIKRGEIFSFTVGGRQLFVRYPKYRFIRGKGVLKAKIPPLPEGIVDAQKETYRFIKDGQIPLHVVADPNKARLILGNFPEGVTVKDASGNIPLHYAALFRPHHIFEPKQLADLLLEESKGWDFEGSVKGDCGVLAPNEVGKTPLSVLCKTVSRKLSLRERWPGSVIPALLESWELLETFCRIAYLSLVARDSLCDRNSSMDGGDEFCILHTIVGTGCPVSIVRHAANKYSDQRSKRDLTGRSVLSVAASSFRSSGTCERSAVLEAVMDASGAGHGRILLAGEAGGRQRLPLHWALAQPHKSRGDDAPPTKEDAEDDVAAIDLLLLAYPWSVETPDPVTRLPPFALAAVGATNSASTVYKLLRESPSLLKHHLGRRDDGAQEVPSCSSRAWARYLHSFNRKARVG